MGCSNSHLRPLFRRCRRRRSKKEESSVGPKTDFMLIDSSGSDDDGSHVLNLQFLGSGAIRNPASTKTSTADSSSSSSEDSPFAIVPLLAQSEASSSQLDFFRMLDAKIEEGPDFDPEEAQVELNQRMQKNLQVWRRGIQSFNFHYNKKKSVPIIRCHWDEDGD